ncbi:UDP-N-acetylmuramate dehydrogenase [uncultured Fenollaria sp.]|uniref:UDP-N-acetylmuramate dehydrogenase n=1 Tax=uncultured Fenollaria sp. TaxID=1686315 RepID=UPI0025DA26D5|nr:UDP-N-acetylmuramate dehydrogenase [uncultured Fenollaria sp.]
MKKIIEEIKRLNIETIKEDESLSKYTTFKIGGPARVLIEAKSDEEVLKLVRLFDEMKEDYLIIGNGSNLLITDTGIERPVIVLDKNFAHIERIDEVTLYAEAGASLKSLANKALELGLGGLEAISGIPGTVGGAVYMNAGAYGSEIKDVVTKIRFIKDDSIAEIDASEANFAHRRSIFQEKGYIILGAYFKLEKKDKKDIEEEQRDYTQRRKDKQPLEYPSAGSVFKRPEGYYASKLIEDAGLKGLSVGGAMVSKKHSGFIINTGSASFDDVVTLIEKVKAIVLEKFAVSLEEEIRIINE